MLKLIYRSLHPQAFLAGEHHATRTFAAATVYLTEIDSTPAPETLCTPQFICVAVYAEMC